MNRVALPLVVIAALVGIALVGRELAQPDEARAVPCTDPVVGCRFDHRGTPIRVQFAKRPMPLDAFGVSVVAPGVRRISAEFQMQGMEMGFNRYDLKPVSPGVFSADVTLPVCVSGRHDWTLFLTLDGRRYAVPFASYR